MRACRWVPGLDLHSSWTEAELFPTGMLILGLGFEPSPAFVVLEPKRSAILFKGRTDPYTPSLHHDEKSQPVQASLAP